MAFYKQSTGAMDPQAKDHIEVVMLAGGNGTPVLSGLPSTENSNTTPMSAGGSFVGEWVDVSGYSDMIVALSTDQNTNYTIQYSSDGANVESSLIRYYRPQFINAPHRFTNTRRYARVIANNITSNTQSYFRLQTTLGSFTELNTPIDSTLAKDFDAIAVRPTDYKHEVAQGRRQGHTTWNKWGYNPSIDTAAEETIRYSGGIITLMNTAATLLINSTSSFDSTSSNGATGVVVYGIDQNRLGVTEVVSLNGTTQVSTTNQFLGINRMALYAANGSYENAGDIYARETSANTVQATIPAGQGTTQQAVFFTQTKHKALVDSVLVNVNKIGGSSPVVTIRCLVTSFVSRARYEVFRIVVDTAVENTLSINFPEPLVIDEQSVIEWRASTTVNSTICSIRFSLIETRNSNA